MTTTIRSSNFNKSIFDPLRHRHVAATPEEMIRQQMLRRMIHQLGYPKGLIAVEKQLKECRRRFDVVCYMPHSDTLKPLLVMECKATPAAWQAAVRQAAGYNFVCQAPFLCIVCMTRIRTLWLHQDKIESVDFLPPYRDLLIRYG